MPALSNIKHENFCRNLIEGAKLGCSATDAYIKAGYSDKGVGPRVGASRLLTKPNIKARLAELSAPAVRKAKITAESLLNELEETRAGAVSAAQFGAATAAIAAKAKISGIMVDRLEIGGPGEFAACSTPAEVVDKLIEQEGAAEALAQLELLQALLIERAADQAIEVLDAEPRWPAGIEPRWRRLNQV